jgi:hypothetical protein
MRRIKTMNDIIVQFARLWGMHEATVLTAEDEDISDELKQWDSEELYSLLKKWSDEYEKCTDDIDTVEFFELKVKELMNEK